MSHFYPYLVEYASSFVIRIRIKYSPCHGIFPHFPNIAVSRPSVSRDAKHELVVNETGCHVTLNMS